MILLIYNIFMIFKNSINNMIHKLRLDEFIKSQKELLNDNKGGFLLPIEAKLSDKEYKRYRHLPIDWSINPITKDMLPDEFSLDAVKTVDLFHRKTINLPYECIIFFDYISGNIIFCKFSDEKPNKVKGEIYKSFLKDMLLASVHNHPIQFYSPPSGRNFQMLGLDFEDYELILSKNELWTLESKQEILNDSEIKIIRKNADEFLHNIITEFNFNFDEGYLVIENINEIYGSFLLNYINNDFNKIKLTRRFLDE